MLKFKSLPIQISSSHRIKFNTLSVKCIPYQVGVPILNSLFLTISKRKIVCPLHLYEMCLESFKPIRL